MPIQIGWHPSLKHTIYYEFAEVWTWQEYGEAFREELWLASHLNGDRYHVIANLLGTALIPKGPIFSNFYSTVKSSPNNLGQVVVITTNRFILAMFATVLKIHPEIRDSLYLTNTLEDGQNYILNLSINA